MQLTDAERLILDAHQVQIYLLQRILTRIALPHIAERDPQEVAKMEDLTVRLSGEIISRIADTKT